MHTRGCEWIVDAHGCDPARLADPDVMRALFASLVELLDLRPVAPAQWHCFPALAAAPGGITGVALLAESHFAVHTFPEHGALTLNLFCCRPRPDWDVAGEVGRFVAAPSFAVSVRRLDRALAP
jgi:S-adenosylmethionine decarboxylase